MFAQLQEESKVASSERYIQGRPVLVVLDLEHGSGVEVTDVHENHRVVISKASVQEGFACGGVYFLGEVRVFFEFLDEPAPVALAYQLEHHLKGTFFGLDLDFRF